MNELQTMQIFEDFPVRTIVDGEIIWFALKDVCNVLGIKNPKFVWQRLDEDERGVGKISTPGGKQEMQTVNEAGLYDVILRSNSEKAKPFRKWVTHDVLPSIRKQGYYSALSPEALIQTIVSAADDKDRYPLVIEAMRAAKVDQSSFIADLTGMKPKDMSQKLFKISDENRHGRVTVMDWKRHHQGDFTAKDLYGKSHLKDYIIDVMVEACNRRRTGFRFYNFVKYCGEIHFTKNGYLAVLDEIDKMGYLSRNPDELTAWREEVKNIEL